MAARKLDIERELLLAIDLTKAHYDALRRESAREIEIVSDVGLTNDDGRTALARNVAKHGALQKALAAYEHALHRFSDFVVRGRTPE